MKLGLYYKSAKEVYKATKMTDFCHNLERSKVISYESEFAKIFLNSNYVITIVVVNSHFPEPAAI